MPSRTPASTARTLLLDALRTNDVRLVAAAMGPHAARLSAHDWRHGVLEVPVRRGAAEPPSHGLGARTDAELLAMVRRYADEREAAGRPVPDDAVRPCSTSTASTTDPEG